MLFERDSEDEPTLNYQSKKVMHMIQLQLLDIESTLHYIQKKQSTHQLKQALSQIYNIFNQMEPVFKHIKGMFLNNAVKKLMNCFGIIYLIQAEHIDHGGKYLKEVTSITSEYNRNSIMSMEIEGKISQSQEYLKTQLSVQKNQKTLSKPFGGVYLYNENYQRHMNGNNQPRPRKTQKKTNLTKEEFKQSIEEDLNQRTYNMPHPDEMLDLFAFKFKYGRENQLVTFHDELQSIAKFFKEAQNDAFQFLNKTKGCSADLEVNQSFKEIMSLIRLQKESKLKDFNSKISSVFKSIKKKAESELSKIEAKLQEVQQIKSNYKPPVLNDFSTQTSNTYEQQLKYLKRSLLDSQQKYRLMCEIKSREIQQSTISQLQLQSQISLKSRQIVYLKINVEESNVIVSKLNKKVKSLIESHRDIKKKVISEFKEKHKNQDFGQIQELQCLKGVTKKLVEDYQEDEALDMLKKQKKLAKNLIIEQRRKSLQIPKSQYAKRFTQQQAIMAKVGSNALIQKWSLSQVSQEQDSKITSRSNLSNMNNMITQHQIKSQQPKINISKVSQQTQRVKRNISIQSIKSANQNSIKKSKYVKKTSHFLQIDRKQNFRHKRQNQEIYEDSLIGSDSSSQSNQQQLDQIIIQEDKKRLELMYQRQMNKSKSRIHDRSSGVLQFGNSLTKNHNNGSSSFRQQSPNIRSSFFSNASYSVKASGSNKMSSIVERQQDVKHQEQIENLNIKIAQLQEFIDSLRIKLESKEKNIFLKLKSEQISITIEPTKPERARQRLEKMKTKVRYTDVSVKDPQQREQQIQYSDLKTYKLGQVKSVRQKRSQKKKQTYFAHQMFTKDTNTKQVSQSKSVMNATKNASEHVKRGEFRTKTNYLSKTLKTNLYDRIKHETQTSKESHEARIETDPSTFIERKEVRTDKENILKLLNKDKKKQLTSVLERNNMIDEQREQQKIVKQLAVKCKNIKEFKIKMTQLHRKRCVEQCTHLQQYLANFVKYREEGKQMLKLHIQNIHQSINEPANELPQLKKKR